MLPGTNGMAIAALVVSIFGGPGLGSILGLAFGITALDHIKRQPQKGRGLALAAVIISSITAVIAAVILIPVIIEDVKNEAAGADSVQPAALKAGDCIRTLDESSAIYDLPVVPCTQPHEAEVYHVFTLPDGDYPGQAAVEQAGDAQCDAAFESYNTEANADLGISYLYPRSQDWSRDKGITCIAISTDGTRTTSMTG